MITNIGTSFNFITSDDRTVTLVTEWNTKLYYVSDGRIRVLPTIRARMKYTAATWYRTSRLTAPVRFLLTVPKQYSLL